MFVARILVQREDTMKEQDNGMRNPRRLAVIVMAFIGLFIVLALSQPVATVAQTGPLACNQVLPLAEKNLSDKCNNLDVNQVCYGNKIIAVEYPDQGAVTPVAFAQTGDIAPLSAFKSITTGPLKLDAGEWGLALVKVQATVPGATAGQAVTFVLYGDTTVSGLTPSATAAPEPSSCSATTQRATYLRAQPDLVSDKTQLLQSGTTAHVTERLANNTWVFANAQGKSGWLFVQNNISLTCDINSLKVLDPQTPAVLAGSGAFYFSTGIGAQSGCQDVPSGGLLVQSPSGQKVSFRVNGVDVTIASTVMFTAQANKTMTLSVLEGHADVDAGGQHQSASTGQMLTIPLGGSSPGGNNPGLDPSGPPSPPSPIGGNYQQICTLAVSAGLTNPCIPPTPIPVTVIPTVVLPVQVAPSGGTCSQRTFNNDGTVCMPGIGNVPCNRNGICDNGEHYYICPEDCVAPLPPNTKPQKPPATVCPPVGCFP
jgi:hypothetical protein